MRYQPFLNSLICAYFLLICFFNVAPIIYANDVEPNSNLKTEFCVSSDTQRIISSWYKGEKTNGLGCGVGIVDNHQSGDFLFFVNVINYTTNDVYGLINLPFEAMVTFNLFNSEGQSVQKSPNGERYYFWSETQAAKWLGDSNPAFLRRKGYMVVRANAYKQITTEISAENSFLITKSGVFYLHTQVCLFSRTNKLSSLINTTILPESVVPVTIYFGDTASTNSALNNPTNHPRIRVND
jgi:hypothetical protein